LKCGYISANKPEIFHCKPRPSRVSLESLGLENIAQDPGNPAKVGENHSARKPVAATFSVLKLSRLIYGPGIPKVGV